MLNPTQARFFALPSLIALPFSITDSLDPFICSGSSQAATPFTFTGLEQSMLNVKHQGGRYQKEQTLVQAFSTKSRRFSKSLRHSLNDSRRQSLGKLARNSLGSRRGSGQLPSPLKSLGSRRGSGQLPSPLKSQRRLTGEGAPFWEQRSGRCDSPGGSLLQKSRKDSTGSLLPESKGQLRQSRRYVALPKNVCFSPSRRAEHSSRDFSRRQRMPKRWRCQFPSEQV